MGKDNEIARLEKYVERLLDEYTSLKAEKKLLERDLHEQKSSNNRLQQRLDALDSERGEVSSRVNSLIGRIEQWEAELAVEAEPENESGRPSPDRSGAAPDTSPGGGRVDASATAESPAAPAVKPEARPEKTGAREEAERSGGVQGSLFAGRPSAG